MQRKRVGLISHDFYPYQGGLGRHATELLRHLNATDTSFSLLGISPQQNNLPDHRTYLGFTRKLPADQIQFSIGMQRSLEQIIQRESLAAVVLNGGPGGVFCLKKPSVPLIYIANHTYAQQAALVPGQGWKRIFCRPEAMGYAQADAIIAISSSTAQSLVTDYAIPACKITVISPGFEFAEAPELTAADSKEILYVGRLESRKGIRFLARAFLELSPEVPDSILHIVGNGRQRRVLLRELRDVVKQGRVVFHGFLSDPDIMSLRTRCAIQVIPSRLEGFGLAAIEAIKAGTPLIATRVPGLMDIVKHEETGLLIPFGDTTALRSTLLAAFARPELLQQMSVTAHTFARSLCSWNTVLPAYERVIQPLVTTA